MDYVTNLMNSINVLGISRYQSSSMAYAYWHWDGYPPRVHISTVNYNIDSTVLIPTDPLMVLYIYLYTYNVYSILFQYDIPTK